MKHVLAVTLTVGCLCSVPSAQNYITFKAEGAQKLFRESRRAVGGEQAVASVTSLVMKGTGKVSVSDGGPADRAIEIRYLFPDQFLRIETAGAWVKRSGFSGATLLTEFRNGQTIEKPPAQMSGPLMIAEKARLARMLLGIASLATSEVWLTVRQPPGETDYAANSSAIRTLQAAGKDNFLASVFYDSPIAVPLRVEYEAGGRKIVTAFGDRRKVDALMMPFTMTTLRDGQPVEELKFTEIAINPPLTKADFGG